MFQILKRSIGEGTPLFREETFDGTRYMVFPVVMLTEGVHHGSSGPCLYTAEELAKLPAAWNMRPVVLRHPVDPQNGTPLSACTKEAVEKQGIGVLMNSYFDVDGKLKSECWMDIVKTNKVAPGLLSTLRSGKVTEISTGHFSDEVKANGEWNGETYTCLASGIVPDHLAILIDAVGACSVADGAGIPRINQDMRTNAALSHEEIRSKLYAAMENMGIPQCGLFIEEVFDNFFIYWIEGQDVGTYFRREYLLKNEEVVLAEPIEKVRREVQYIVVENEKHQPKEKPVMNEELMKQLGLTVLSDAGKAVLAALDEKDTQVIKSAFTANQTAATETPIVKTPETPPAPVTVNEYLASAPAEVRETLAEGMRAASRQRQTLVATITSNKKCAFTVEELGQMNIEQLTKLSALAASSTHNFEALGANAGGVGAEEPLPALQLGNQK